MKTSKNTKHLPGGGIIEDDRTPEQKAKTLYLIVGTDSFLSGLFPSTPKRSLAAWPVYADSERGQHNNWEYFFDCVKRRTEMKRVRLVSARYRPRLRTGDHLHIYNNEAREFVS